MLFTRRRVAAAALLLAGAGASSTAVAAPAASSLASMEQLTATTDALFAATDWSPRPASAAIGQITPNAGGRFGALAAYGDALGMQVAGGTAMSARIDQVVSGSNVAQLVQVAQIPAGADRPAWSGDALAEASSDPLGLRYASMGDNVAGWSQTGSGNFLRALQFGVGNVAYQKQSGSDLTALVVQAGARNSASITQEGSQHLGIVYQNGQANEATIRQQNALAYASIFQNGTGNVAAIRQ